MGLSSPARCQLALLLTTADGMMQVTEEKFKLEGQHLYIHHFQDGL